MQIIFKFLLVALFNPINHILILKMEVHPYHLSEIGFLIRIFILIAIIRQNIIPLVRKLAGVRRGYVLGINFNFLPTFILILTIYRNLLILVFFKILLRGDTWGIFLILRDLIVSKLVLIGLRNIAVNLVDLGLRNLVWSDF